MGASLCPSLSGHNEAPTRKEGGLTDSQLPRSRREAKQDGAPQYFTGKPCKRGHTTTRITSNGRCTLCSNAHTRQWRLANPEYVSEYNQQWKLENPNYWVVYWQENRGRHNAANTRRRSAKKQRTPPWLTPDDHQRMTHIYQTCPEGFHVDHIVPLQGVSVCGLHVPWNLRHLESGENLRKRNYHESEI